MEEQAALSKSKIKDDQYGQENTKLPFGESISPVKFQKYFITVISPLEC